MCQMHDPDFGEIGLHMAEPLTYLIDFQLAQREFEEATVHANLVKEAAFFSWTLLIPKPPSLVGRQTALHLIWFLF